MSDREFALYDQLEEGHWWFRGRRKILSAFLDSVPNKTSRSLLEIGCGTGGNLKHLFDGFGRRVGLERNHTALMYAHNKVEQQSTVTQGDANNLPFGEETFDCVAFLDVLFHRGIPDVHATLTQAHRILKPDGYILVSDGAYNFLAGQHSESVDSARRFTKTDLRNRLQNAGFEIVRASYWGAALFFPMFVKRVIIDRLFTKKAATEDNFDFARVPVIDDLLYALLAVERPLLRWVGLPFGASVCALARKP